MALDPGARATYLAYRAGAALAQVLPPAVAGPTARVAARVAAVALPGRRRMVERHQRRVARGDLDGRHLRDAVHGAFDSYARYWLEMFTLPRDAGGDLAAHFDIEGWHHIEDGLALGRGVVVALPHLGGWEYAGAWMATQHDRPLAVVEPVEPPELFEWFVRQRAAMGIEVVPLGDGVVHHLLAALRANRVVALVSDRDLTGDGVEVEFFGERTTLPAGPATLALRTGAVLLTCAVYFRGAGGHHAVVRPPVDVGRKGRLREDVARITQVLAREFEALIEVAPDQWHLMQPNWPSDRAAAVGTGR